MVNLIIYLDVVRSRFRSFTSKHKLDLYIVKLDLYIVKLQVYNINPCLTYWQVSLSHPSTICKYANCIFLIWWFSVKTCLSCFDSPSRRIDGGAIYYPFGLKYNPEHHHPSPPRTTGPPLPLTNMMLLALKAKNINTRHRIKSYMWIFSFVCPFFFIFLHFCELIEIVSL